MSRARNIRILMYGIDELHIKKKLRDVFDRLEDIFEPFSETFSPMGCHKNKLVLKVDHPENRILVFYIRRSHCNRINHCISYLKNVFGWNAFFQQIASRNGSRSKMQIGNMGQKRTVHFFREWLKFIESSKARLKMCQRASGIKTGNSNH